MLSAAVLLESDDEGFRLLASRALKCPQIMIPAIRWFSFGSGISRGWFYQHEPFHPAALARHMIDDLECNRWIHVFSMQIALRTTTVIYAQ